MKKVTIIKEQSNKRIDKFLTKEVFFNDKVTRGEIIRNIKENNVLANGRKIKPSYILKEGDELEINLAKDISETIPSGDIDLEIIFQDENIIVINKPAGIQVHPDQKEKRNTLVNALLFQFPEIREVGDEPKMRPGIIHRLDKDTSGVMIVAKNQKTFLELKDKFKNREVAKKYLAIVKGILKEKKGLIEKPIARASNYKKQVIAGKKTKTKIRPAVTEYEVIQGFEGYSLVEARPKTGRMHQIRVHLASIGHPIIGDAKYSSKNKKEDVQAGRQMLHAKSIDFFLFGKKYSFQTDCPKDFEKYLRLLDEKAIKR